MATNLVKFDNWCGCFGSCSFASFLILFSFACVCVFNLVLHAQSIAPLFGNMNIKFPVSLTTLGQFSFNFLIRYFKIWKFPESTFAMNHWSLDI